MGGLAAAALSECGTEREWSWEHTARATGTRLWVGSGVLRRAATRRAVGSLMPVRRSIKGLPYQAPPPSWSNPGRGRPSFTAVGWALINACQLLVCVVACCQGVTAPRVGVGLANYVAGVGLVLPAGTSPPRPSFSGQARAAGCLVRPRLLAHLLPPCCTVCERYSHLVLHHYTK